MDLIELPPVERAPPHIYPINEQFPLHNAVATRDFDLVQQMVWNGYDVNTQHYDRVTPLHMACLTGDLRITSYLVQNGALIDAPSIDNSTPLCDAAASGSVECVKLLLAHGAIVNPHLLISTPLHEAALRGHTDVVECLLNAGARLEASDLHYGTPLHAACSPFTPSASCVKVLLQGGANVNALKTHKTPLHMLANNGCCIEVALLLISYGANVYLRDNQGRTPRDIASIKSRHLYDILENHEKEPPTLTQICRLVIRSHLGPSRLPLIPDLNAPQILKRFLE